MALPPTIEGRFVIESQAAAGGMGTVYRGRDLTTSGAVAVKVLHRTGVRDQERFLREARLLAELSSPAIARYVAHGILDDGSPYLVMAWIEGETLEVRLHGAGLSVPESLTLVERVADALEPAHARGIVHRDLKPSNLIFPDGDVARTTLLDFGVARPIAQVTSLTETGAVVGTPTYMAPEQVRGAREITAAADVFALGCVLYECLTGRLAFEGLHFLALRAKILRWDPPPPSAHAPEVPPALDQLLAEMLAKDPAARPRDATALKARLAALPAIARGQARRTRHADPPTVVGSRPAHADPAGHGRPLAIVAATPPEAADAAVAPTITLDDVAPLRASIEAAIAPFGASADVLQDGAVIAALRGDASAREQAARAVRCAQAIRRAFPDVLVAIASGFDSGQAEAGLIDDVVQSLARDALARAFSGVGRHETIPAGAIRIDARTASLLEPDAAVVRTRSAIYLHEAGA